MTKPFSEDDLSSQLVQDRTWRIKELSDLKTTIRRSDQIQQRVLLRALVAICYAHWEGYVKFSARKYMQHVSLRKLPYNSLNQQFYRNNFLARLNSLSQSKTSIAQRCDLIDEILGSKNKRFSYSNEELINTQSNLNFGVFCDICLVCGIPPMNYAKQEAFIDIILLKRRNSIAHGEDTFIHEQDLDMLVDTTIDLMRNFADELDNCAALKTYKASIN